MNKYKGIFEGLISYSLVITIFRTKVSLNFLSLRLFCRMYQYSDVCHTKYVQDFEIDSVH
jgi:hypothetical protein